MKRCKLTLQYNKFLNDKNYSLYQIKIICLKISVSDQFPNSDTKTELKQKVDITFRKRKKINVYDIEMKTGKLI